ncbi:hypothetical protein COEREDRAFT_7716 [Coemansia reversa NRRL 1564]|uniref:Uncharacterized protein n=1 Tax=Coemansia reversa (strain ATCC 12441 / NRRL 1564) TaxID=763665 RepID=A0A2G5BEE7_COERN|nr:hypothetical protein COEREDRAFT_7716 [Coemansia reversa NRRL 1564]|eukprot:PIA17371.1 hypothetical protein COEREDRAFT_7716 [Coemansia reversa NRRL 1564]
MLFSFRYRHLSAEDIDILCELRPKFLFDTPPIERDLVRANICSTCQQRLRRARLNKQRRCQNAEIGQPIVVRSPNQLNKDGPSNLNTRANMSTLELQKSHGSRQLNLSRGGWDTSAITSQFHDSALRSTLQSASHVPSRQTGTPARLLQNNRIQADKTTNIEPVPFFRPSNMHEQTRSCLLPPANSSAIDMLHPPSHIIRGVKPIWRVHSDACIRPSASHKNTFGLQMIAEQAYSEPQCGIKRNISESIDNTVPNTQTPNKSSECVGDDPDKTHVDLDIAENSKEKCFAKPSPLLLPLPRSLSRPASPHPALPPLHMLLPAIKTRAEQDGCFYAENLSGDIGNSLSAQSMLPNIEFRDAVNSILFRESLSEDYPLEDVFMQYYPDSPQSLLFYMQENIALPRKTTLGGLFKQYNIRELPVVIWARMPVSANPGHQPQWQVVT